MQRFLPLALVLSIVAAATLVACGGGGSKSSSSGATASPASGQGPDVPAGAASGASVVQSIDLKAVENGDAYSFQPNALTAKTGQVVIHYTNQAGNAKPHTFELKTLDGSGDVVKSDMFQPGTSGDVSFTVPAAGTYQFLCYERGHADRGQKGTLVVS